MRSIKKLSIAAAIVLLPGCGELLGAADTILTYKGQVTDTIITNTIEGARRYCLLTPEVTRLQYRERTDLGMGPVIEVHCDRFLGL